MSDSREPERRTGFINSLRQPEPKLAVTLVETGHPVLGFILGMSWVLGGTVVAVASALAVLLR